MAIALDATTNQTGIIPYTPPTVTISHTTSGSERLLVVCVQVYTQAVTGITYAGTAMSLADSVSNGNFRTYIYYLANPALGANNVVITFDASGGYEYATSINSYTGVDQSNPLDATNTATGSSKTGGTVTVTTVANNCWVVDSLIRDSQGYSGITVGSGQTERYNILTGGFGCYIGVSDEGPKTPAGGVVMNWTWNTPGACAWATVAASFAPFFVSLEQEGFLWRADDGDEVEANPLESQDANITRAKNINTRLRVLVDAIGNPPSKQFQLEYRKKGTDTWNKV